MNALKRGQSLARFAGDLSVFASDVAGGFWAIIHNGFALLGVFIVTVAVLIASRADLRQQAESHLNTWLTARQVSKVVVVAPVAVPHPLVVRATAADPQALPGEQARLTLWIAQKYQVAPEPVAALVANAYKAGQTNHVDPTLILAVMAIESGFNPFAQSAAGAQGLMQVMTSVHVEKYNGYGGHYAAFDPLSNLRVGVRVLRDCINKAGSTAGGLRCYVGAAHLRTDRGYARKVLAEYARMQQVMQATPPPPVQHPNQTIASTNTDKSRAASVMMVAALARAEAPRQ